MRNASWAQQVADRLLTTDPVQRFRLAQVGLAIATMAVCVSVMHFVAWAGKSHAAWVWWWTAFALGGLALSYVAILRGRTRDLADPSLTLPQMLYALAIAAAGYALAGELRGAVLPVLIVVLMFGMFQLRPRTLHAVSAGAVLLFGIVMVVMAALKPQVYAPAVELGHFLIVATTVSAVSVLGGRLAGLRERMRRQKRELAQALIRMEELATRDMLTGLLNRRHMTELLEQERQRCVRSGRTFCLAMIDIDGFKRINQEAGRGAGDEVLRIFAREGLAIVRMADVLARWDGDGFVLMLSDSRMALARGALERLRERTAALVLNIGGRSLRITVSAGLTEHIAGESVAQSLARAELALSEAQSQGANRVTTL
jgi:diguanylate cyclase (GGDEF)-like protein